MTQGVLSMLKASILFTLLFSLSSLSLADSKIISGVTLSGTVSYDKLEGTTLKSVAGALRQKKVAFLNFDVYVAEILLPESIAWDKKSTTFENSTTAGIMMTFLRDVSAKDVSAAFADGLRKNNAVMNHAPIVEFLKKVASMGDVKKNEVLSLVRLKKADQDVLLIEVKGRFSEKVVDPNPWTNSVLQIWSGLPSDPGLQTFKMKIFN